MVPIFRELYNAGRRKHQQHLINHNLSQIRIHYHQEVGGPFPCFGADSVQNETPGILRQQAILRGRASVWCIIAMAMCVLDAKETTQAEAKIWQNQDRNTSPSDLHPNRPYLSRYKGWQCLSRTLQLPSRPNGRVTFTITEKAGCKNDFCPKGRKKCTLGKMLLSWVQLWKEICRCKRRHVILSQIFSSQDGDSCSVFSPFQRADHACTIAETRTSRLVSKRIPLENGAEVQLRFSTHSLKNWDSALTSWNIQYTVAFGGSDVLSRPSERHFTFCAKTQRKTPNNIRVSSSPTAKIRRRHKNPKLVFLHRLQRLNTASSLTIEALRFYQSRSTRTPGGHTYQSHIQEGLKSVFDRNRAASDQEN